MALSANNARTFEEDLEFGDALVAASTTIYDGAILGLASGYARGLVAGDKFAGVALQKRDNSAGSAGDLKVRLRKRGYLVMNVTGASAVTDKGSTVYASADDTLTLTAGSNTAIGVVHRWVSGTQCIVWFDCDTATDRSSIQHTLTVGVDDTGYDVKFFGATTGKYMLWDESADKLIVSGTADLGTSCEADAYTVGGVAGADFSGAITNLTAVKGIVTAAS